MQANTIEEVIQCLDEIIEECKKKPSRIGYFASLYNLVTKKVKEEADKGKDSVFEDTERMKVMDVIFANRYLDVYEKFHKKEKITECWDIALTYNQYWYPVVLQHLLAAMNAHISLDLGVAAVEAVRKFNQPIESFHSDFNEINNTLGSLVSAVEKNMSAIWPFLRGILKAVPGSLDRQMVNFSVEIARDGAWKFATELAALEGAAYQQKIAERDASVARIGKNVVSPPWWIKMPLLGVKMTEWGGIRSQIEVMNGEKGWNPELIRLKK